MMLIVKRKIWWEGLLLHPGDKIKFKRGSIQQKLQIANGVFEKVEE